MQYPLIALIMNTEAYSSWKRGSYNGYVLIPSNHVLYAKDEDEATYNLLYPIHGGITYSQSAENDWSKMLLSLGEILDISDETDKMRVIEYLSAEKYWLLGFDTAHRGDNPENWNKTAVTAETEKLFIMLKHLS